MKIVPVILCGGSGTRLWPMSREYFPKQLLNLGSDELSMLQGTALRLQGLETLTGNEYQIEQPLVVTNEAHRFLVAEQMRALELEQSCILLEPVGRNTAPALCLAAQWITTHHQDGIMLVMPADHLIKSAETFHQAIVQGLSLVSEEERFVTFGIVPDYPETGYGYIQKGSELDGSTGFSIASFAEKPDQTIAQQYLDSGDYFWNSGMFLFSVSAWIAATQKYVPDIEQACQKAYQAGQEDADFYRVNSEYFSQCPEDSIDYAVMEHVTDLEASSFKGAVVPLDAGWSDVGSWQSLWETSERNEQGNVLTGDVMVHECSESLIMGQHRMVAGIGLKNMVVVETADAVLVADRDASQDVKVIVNALKAAGRDETVSHRRVFRPWGSYESIDNGDRFQVKRIIVSPQASLSLQMHYHRAEHWIVVSGTAQVTRGEEQFLLSENESTYIPLGVTHRLQNPGNIPLEIIEVQSGTYLGEDDIVRFDDVYGRDADQTMENE